MYKARTIILAIAVCYFIVTTGCTSNPFLHYYSLDYKVSQPWFSYNNGPLIAVCDPLDTCFGKGKLGTIQLAKDPSSAVSTEEFIKRTIILQLSNAGFNVSDSGFWSLSESTIPEDIKNDFILGIRIRKIWINIDENLFIRSIVQIELILADPKIRQIIWTANYIGIDHKDRATYNINQKILDSFGRALDQTIKNIFEDHNFKYLFRSLQ